MTSQVSLTQNHSATLCLLPTMLDLGIRMWTSAYLCGYIYGTGNKIFRYCILISMSTRQPPLQRRQLYTRSFVPCKSAASILRYLSAYIMSPEGPLQFKPTCLEQYSLLLFLSPYSNFSHPFTIISVLPVLAFFLKSERVIKGNKPKYLE